MPKRVDYLRLVTESSPLLTEQETAFQRTLFQVASKYLLVFLDMSNTSDGMFLNVLRGGMIRVFDLRVAPRFDIGQLTRARVFQLFDTLSIDYFDIAGTLSVLSRFDARLNPENIAPAIISRMSQRDLPGPNLFLLENDNRIKAFAELLPLSLPQPPKRGWHTLIPYDQEFRETFMKQTS